MENRYEIKTISDFLKVPGDRLDACLEEFKTGLAMARLIEIMSAGKEHPAPLERFVWIDDEKRNVTVNLTVIEAEP
jgi:hypothetical protein